MSIVPEQTGSPYVTIEVLNAQPDHKDKQYSHNQELPDRTDVVIDVLDHLRNSPAYNRDLGSGGVTVKRDLESGRVTVIVNPAPTGLRFLVMSIFSIFSK